MSKSLVEAFNIKRRSTDISEVSDYEIFADKELLEQLRLKIMGNLTEREVLTDEPATDFIDVEIEGATEGYDLTNEERNYLRHLIENELNGYGPLTELLKDKNVTDIMVNSPKEIYIEIDGKMVKDDSVSFINNDHIIRSINKMLNDSKSTIDLAKPIIDARLKDGSRIYGILPPLAVNGPMLTIHKFKNEAKTIEDFIRMGSLTTYMANFLAACVRAKCNILISGSSSSGGTTLLGALCDLIADDERIITIEDMAELKINKKHLVSLESKATNYNISLNELIKSAVRMRPDRVIVGELIGDEAFLLLQIMNSGSEGAMSLIHAVGVNDAIKRLETLVLMSGVNIPLKVIREYILSAIDIVVNIEKLSDGKRKITSICELKLDNNGEIVPDEIFAFRQDGMTENKEVKGEYILFKNKKLKILPKLKNAGIDDIKDMF